MEDLEYNDLEYREERKDILQPVKKHIPLKLKTTSVPNNLNATAQSTLINQFQFNPIIPNVIKQLPTLNDQPQIDTHFQQTQTITTPTKKQKVNHLSQFNDIDDRAIDDVVAKPQSKIEKLNWNFNVNFIGKKSFEQSFFFCDICTLPILKYGRNMPCKHVFCIKCAYENAEKCYKVPCRLPVERIEEALHGQIFICTFGKISSDSNITTPNNNNNNEIINQALAKSCERSYMSMRDLDAHIKYRHLCMNNINENNEQYLNSSNNNNQQNRVNNLITIRTGQKDSYNSVIN